MFHEHIANASAEEGSKKQGSYLIRRYEHQQPKDCSWYCEKGIDGSKPRASLAGGLAHRSATGIHL